MKRSKYLKNAFVLSLGGVLAKGIGAVYRSPLSNFLGGYGIGLYQMAYPLFCVLLTFSSAGIPSAFSRMIARETACGRGCGNTLKTALRLFALLGLCGTALMCLFAPHMSNLQGDTRLLKCYLMLAPSVFLVALIAVLRGYFQGKNDMKPTAVSEIVEQLVKAGTGLFFAYRFREEPALAVAYCLLAVTLSEGAALLYLIIRTRGEERIKSLSVRRTTGMDVLFAALPVMAATSLLPLSQTADSVILVRLLSNYTPHAVSLYGLFTGGALSLINLPATACYGLAAASVPAVAQCFARGEEEEGRKRAMYALFLTLILSVPCALGLFFLAKHVVALLYPSLAEEDAVVLISLLKLLSVSAVSLAGVDTLAACLTGMGKAKSAALAMLIAVIVKFVLQWALVASPRLSIGGAAIAANACYLVAFFLDLLYTVKKKRVKKHDNSDRSGNGEGRSDLARPERDEKRGQGAGAHRVARV